MELISKIRTIIANISWKILLLLILTPILGEILDVYFSKRAFYGDTGDFVESIIEAMVLGGVIIIVHQKYKTEKHLRQELELEKRKLDSLVKTMSLSITVRDKEYKLTYQNASNKDIFGDVTGNYCYKVFAGLEDICEGCPVEKTFIDGKSYVHEKRAVLPTGEVTYWENTSYPIFDDKGNMTGGLEINRNITEKKKLEERLKNTSKMEAIGKLAGGIAHEFNNNLTSILGYAEMLDNCCLGVKEKKYLSRIIKGGNRAAKNVQELLLFSRKKEFHIVNLDLNTVINETISLLYPSIGKNIKIISNLNAKNHWIRGDVDELCSALLNVAINANDAMKNGGTLTFSTQNVTIPDGYLNPFTKVDPGEYIRLDISDTGIGMDHETQSMMFEPFFTTKEVGEGTGLGLAAVFGTIDKLSGFIEVKSVLNEGTVFSIYLKKNEHEEKKAEIASDEVITGSGKILVIDDEELVRELIIDQLESIGYNSLTFNSGRKAVDFYKNNLGSINLVILDMIMPDMDGAATYYALKTINPTVKVIICSGYSINDAVEKLLADGASGFLNKPFEISDLSRIIYETLLKN